MHRWCKEHCPGCISFCRDLPVPPAGPAALEGTKAHRVLELALLNHYRHLAVADDERKQPIHLKPHSVRAVDQALQKIFTLVETGMELLAVEQRVIICKDVWGTADIIGYDAANRRLMVLDYKNGTVPVEAKDNFQLRAYGWGAYLAYQDSGLDIDSIYMGVIQPNSANGKTYSGDEEPLWKLFEFGIYIEQCVRVTQAPQAPVRAGYWCQWCPGAKECPEHLLEKAEARVVHEHDDELNEAKTLINAYLNRD